MVKINLNLSIFKNFLIVLVWLTFNSNFSLQIDKENFQKKRNFEKELKSLIQKKKWGKYSLLKEDLKKVK